ncbi:MAG: GGDEF domain-containing protein [Tepidiformaceae bacterium]
MSDDRSQSTGRLSRIAGRFWGEATAAGGGGALAAVIFNQPWIAVGSLAGTVALLAWILRQATRERDGATENLEIAHVVLERQRNRPEYEDPETGLGTRTLLEMAFRNHVARFARREDPFSLAILEMADAYRPERALAPVTAASIGRGLIGVARSEDTVCRLGNGTFAVILASTDADGGDAFVPRARTRVGSGGHAGDEGEVYVTIEAGVTMWRPELETLDAMIEDARRDMTRFIVQHDRQKRVFEADEVSAESAG